MIKANKTDIVIAGNLADILAELSGAIETIHKAASEQLGKEAADALIVAAGRAAFMSVEEIDEVADELNTILEGAMKK